MQITLRKTPLFESYFIYYITIFGISQLFYQQKSH
mgnify:CR=1 FL=1